MDISSSAGHVTQQIFVFSKFMGNFIGEYKRIFFLNFTLLYTKNEIVPSYVYEWDILTWVFLELLHS